MIELMKFMDHFYKYEGEKFYDASDVYDYTKNFVEYYDYLAFLDEYQSLVDEAQLYDADVLRYACLVPKFYITEEVLSDLIHWKIELQIKIMLQGRNVDGADIEEFNKISFFIASSEVM